MRRSVAGPAALLAAILLVDGAASARLEPLPPPPAPAAAPAAPAVAHVSAPAPPKPGRPPRGLGSRDLARIAGRLNPALSPRDRERVGAAVLASARRHGLDPELVLAVIEVESDVRPEVVSPSGALGLMQVMPEHFARRGRIEEALEIEHNIEMGCALLASNIARHGESRGILAYFWGESIRGDAYLHRVQAARAVVRRANS